MKNIHFPLFKTKIEKLRHRFDLSDPKERKKYFHAKAGKEIVKLRKYLKKNTFVGYLLGKKNSGKGTYSKLFMEAIGEEHVQHISVGDVVRDMFAALSSKKRKKELVDFLDRNYRGFHSIEETVKLIANKNQSTLIPSELILALIKFEISKRPKKALFIDGFPRALDQITHSLFLKEIIGYREDPDFFIFIEVPEAVIDERMKSRVVCPICKTPRGLKLLTTKRVGYDEDMKQFYLICDTPSCAGERMVAKEGDELGIEPIRQRLELDDQIFRRLMALRGIPRISLRNSIPVTQAKKYVDDYEITPAYDYRRDQHTGKVITSQKPWTVKDDDGVRSYSLLPAAIVVALIKQIVEVLGL
ncbi:MAG: nucleoside monophosphate kinase [Candidatus Liptonbacteria bacterium]|nr:nucleoside monophosphate kinase [Candidatus Liptonbacteria bacterium]